MILLRLRVLCRHKCHACALVRHDTLPQRINYFLVRWSVSEHAYKSNAVEAWICIRHGIECEDCLCLLRVSFPFQTLTRNIGQTAIEPIAVSLPLSCSRFFPSPETECVNSAIWPPLPPPPLSPIPPPFLARSHGREPACFLRRYQLCTCFHAGRRDGSMPVLWNL